MLVIHLFYISVALLLKFSKKKNANENKQKKNVGLINYIDFFSILKSLHELLPRRTAATRPRLRVTVRLSEHPHSQQSAADLPGIGSSVCG